MTNMKKNLLKINPKKETKRIEGFLQKTFTQQNISNALVGLSGGIDSATSFYLLRRILKPEQIFVLHLYYAEPQTTQIENMLKLAKIPKTNSKILSIKESVDTIAKTLNIQPGEETKVRLGNIAARVRMIMLFDYAKAHNALVTGTENKSENLLGYFTRFGDQASDIEPIEHLYKTQIFQLAQHLGVPDEVIKQKPTAGLWQGQTDEGQFGFTYEEADQVLYLALEKHITTEELIKQGFLHAKKILQWREQNLFKQNTPYTIND
jgi:NAD+ synthase